MNNYKENKQFEDDVRAICRALWPEASTGGAETILGLERDGVFETRDIIHLVEATTSRSKTKASEKLGKMARLVVEMRRKVDDKNFKIWLITPHDPEGDQSALKRNHQLRKKAKCPIEILSLITLFSKLVNASEYIFNRKNYYFGSVRDLKGGKAQITQKYVGLDFLNEDEILIKFDQIECHLINNSKKGAVFLGDFGSGKSMTLRELFLANVNAFRNGKTSRFPVYLNLIDHFGQRSPAEALMRHCENIGFSNHTGIVSAWRSGFVDLFLDGFDELYTSKFILTARKMRNSRFASLELVRKFSLESPDGTKIFIAGRDSYFGERISELKTSLGVDDEFEIFNIGNFTDEQIKEYLSNSGVNISIPDWMPRRPLLLGYLVSRGILDEDAGHAYVDHALGWDFLISKICDREADQAPGAIADGAAIRRFLERLAWDARCSSSGRGPLAIEKFREVFEEIFGETLDQESELFVFRLCGLSAATGDSAAREFFDLDFADACTAGMFAQIVISPYEHEPLAIRRGRHHLGSIGVDLAHLHMKRSGVTNRQISAFVEAAISKEYDDLMIIDVFKIWSEHLQGPFPNAVVKGRDISEIVFDEHTSARGLTFEECIIEKIVFDVDSNNFVPPRIKSSLIALVAGRSSVNDCPKDLFDKNCDILAFSDNFESNSAIMRANIPINLAILITVLRKLFIQKGRARKENAFYRGIEPQHRQKVTEILSILQRHGFANIAAGISGNVYVPNYSMISRALEIIHKPLQVRDDVVREIRDI